MRSFLQKVMAVGILVFGLGLAIPTNGYAATSHLYWGAPRVNTGSVRTCFNFANDAMRLQNLQNIRRTGSEVTGFSGSNYAAITCMGTAPSATAVIMVIGDNANDAAGLRDRLSNQISKLKCIDTPC